MQVSSVWCIVTFVFDKCCSHPLKELSFSKYVVAVVFVVVVLSNAITFKGTSSPSQNMFCKKNTFNFKGTNLLKTCYCTTPLILKELTSLNRFCVADRTVKPRIILCQFFYESLKVFILLPILHKNVL